MKKRFYSIITIVAISIMGIGFFSACTSEEDNNKTTRMTTYKTQVNKNSFHVLDTALINENVGYFQGKYSIDMASFINDENFKNILIEIQEYTKYFYQNLNTATADELNISASHDFTNDFNDFVLYMDKEDYENAALKIQTFSLLFFNENITAESLQNNTSALFVKSNEMRDNVTSSFEVLSNSYKAILSMNDQELSNFIDVALQYRLLLEGNDKDPSIIFYAPAGTSPGSLMHNATFKNCYEIAGIAMTGAVTAATGSYIASLLGCAGYGPAYLYCAGVYTAVYGVAIAGAAYTYNVAVENCVLKA